MKNKHAYLIMAHNQFDVLEMLIRMLDYEYHDIYIHIDKKVKKFPFDKFLKIPKKSAIYFTKKRINVKWGGFSQIKTELLLLNEAKKHKYRYYHLLSGTDLLIKNKEVVYDFFESNYGCEYVHFDSISFDKKYDYRVQKYNFFPDKKNIFFKVIKKIIIKLQFMIDRTKNCNLKFQKGANWFSITDELVEYIIFNKKIIYNYFKFSKCGDEMFIQTIVYNSKFWDKVPINARNGDYNAIKRLIDWDRGNPYEFTIEDYDLLFNSNAFFARKFNWYKDKNIVVNMAKMLEGGKND